MSDLAEEYRLAQIELKVAEAAQREANAALVEARKREVALYWKLNHDLAVGDIVEWDEPEKTKYSRGYEYHAVGVVPAHVAAAQVSRFDEHWGAYGLIVKKDGKVGGQERYLGRTGLRKRVMP